MLTTLIGACGAGAQRHMAGSRAPPASSIFRVVLLLDLIPPHSTSAKPNPANLEISSGVRWHATAFLQLSDSFLDRGYSTELAVGRSLPTQSPIPAFRP